MKNKSIIYVKVVGGYFKYGVDAVPNGDFGWIFLDLQGNLRHWYTIRELYDVRFVP